MISSTLDRAELLSPIETDNSAGGECSAESERARSCYARVTKTAAGNALSTTGSDSVRDCKGGDQAGFVRPKRVGGEIVPARFGRAITRSPVMQQALGTLSRLASTELTITLLGETGTGKDVLAHAVHEQSPRAGGPFTIFDCGAVAASLAESELFGYERGAFTGAVATHLGAFERANGGTLFLDEIGELPLALQPRLLRALENRSVQRVGGNQSRTIDVRVIAATHRDLPAKVAEKTFREDLFFRLSGAVIPVPALRQRIADLPLLIPALLADLGRPELQLSRETFAVLAAQAWPGNVRELKNTLASAIAFVEGGTLEPRHLLFLVPSEPVVEQLRLGGQTLENLEREAILQTLAGREGDRAQTADALGISLASLQEKLLRLGVD
ncbi:MAG: sigma-54 dependent transcriptional regulator [Polyangiaceae bacterium]